MVEQAQQYLNTIAGFLIVLGLLFIFRNALQGMGSTLVPMLAAPPSWWCGCWWPFCFRR